jgi:Helix-turn-helix domain
MLAGISAEYYLRLEVGRDKNPSPQVVEALARALPLDIKATKDLQQLANPIISRWDHSPLDAVADGLDELIDQLPFPAIVANRYQDVLAANRWPRPCRRDSHLDKTSCAGVF